jgi:hypothetical protein
MLANLTKPKRDGEDHRKRYPKKEKRKKNQTRKWRETRETFRSKMIATGIS